MTGRLRFLRSGTGAVGAALLVAVLLVALVGPFFSPHAPDKPIGVALEGPTADAPFGTDFLGRDVLSRVLWGGRSVLALAGLATVLAYIGGSVIGLVAGYSRSLLDPLLMRAADVMLSFPALLFLLVLVTGAGTSKAVLVVGVALVQLPLVARIVRTATLEQSVRGFVEAAVARGERTSAVLRREILPNIVAPIVVQMTVTFSAAIISEASLSFLGLGAQPPTPSWGRDLNEGRRYLEDAPWLLGIPTVVIMVAVLCFNFIGDGLRDALDPRLKR